MINNTSNPSLEKILPTDVYLSSQGQPIRLKSNQRRLDQSIKKTIVSPKGIYQGDIKESTIDGKGLFFFHNGFSREGLFYKRKLLKGVCRFETSQAFYESRIKDGKPNGEGVFIFKEQFNMATHSSKNIFESPLSVSPWGNGVFYMGNSAEHLEQTMTHFFLDQKSPLIEPKISKINSLFNHLIYQKQYVKIQYENLVYEGEAENDLPHGSGFMRDRKGFYEKGLFRQGFFVK